MSTSPIKTVMVLGASGNVGRPIVSELLAHHFTVSALIRASSTATFDDPAVRVVRTDYSPASLREAFKGQDAVVSTIATLHIPEQLAAIDAMIEAGVKRFIPSEYGVDTSGPEVLEKLPLAAGKVGTVQYLKSKEGEIEWTGVIVGAFLDWCMIHGLQGWDVKGRKVKVWDDGEREWEATNIGQIARATVACLTGAHYEATRNRYVYVNSLTLTQNQVVRELERIVGEKFEVEYVSSKVLDAEAKQELASGEMEMVGTSSYPKGAVKLIACQLYNYGGLNNYSKAQGLWNDRLGLPKESLEETLKRVVAAVS